MLNQLNTKIDEILCYLDKENQIPDYTYLITNLSNANQPDYQSKFYTFWQFNNAYIKKDGDFMKHYFNQLIEQKNEPKTLFDLTKSLYSVCCVGSQQRIQFSFATKLFHMCDVNSPIYDSRICTFYGVKSPKSESKSVDKKIEEYIDCYDTIKINHSEAINSGILNDSIIKFKDKFNSPNISDMKIIDSLIWAYQAI